ncbi:MAG: PAS-domain containing protein [Hyphomicrobiaceae bacterium]
MAARREDDDALAAVLSGADVGLALYDDGLRLLACNTLYRTLFGYQASDAVPGVLLADLIRLSLKRTNSSAETIDAAIVAALDRLKPGRSYTFRYATANARFVEVNRRVLPSGSLVETVREVHAAPSGTDLNTQLAQIAEAARTRMVHALDVMADAFSLYDDKDQLVVYNRKFVDCNPHVADLIMPGVGFEHLLREAVRRGGLMLNGRTPESYIDLRLQQHRNPTDPYETQLADGRWIQINEKKTSDGNIVGIQSDITHMKLRELDLLRISKQLHARNAHFDAALNNMIQGLCLFDGQQRLLVANRRYLEMYGFSPDVVKPGIRLDEIMRYSVSLGNYTEEEAARAQAERRDRSRLSSRVTIKQRLSDGRVIAVMSEPMEDGGTVATYHDITDLERHEERNREYTLKLERSNRELEEFAYVASHDLQEPLRKIEAFGDRLRTRFSSQLPEDGQMFIERMQHAAGRMRRLISDLLGYSRVTTKANPFRAVDLNKVLADVLGDLQIRIDESKATIKTAPMPTIQADATQMGQLIQNMLSNALKFVKPDVPPVIEVTATIEDGLDQNSMPHRECVIRIADNGIGFENKYKDQIFKIFQRLHGRLEYEGTGVGLATCRKIVERHNGIIDCDGRPGEGATFIIRLPMTSDEPRQAG